jgi:hypothetical protein
VRNQVVPVNNYNHALIVTYAASEVSIANAPE